MNLDEIYKVVCKADDYPNQPPRVYRLQKGDSFVLSHVEERYKVGMHFQNHPNLIVTRIYYTPKKWWQFWKRRKVLGYEIECIE